MLLLLVRAPCSLYTERKVWSHTEKVSRSRGVNSEGWGLTPDAPLSTWLLGSHRTAQSDPRSVYVPFQSSVMQRCHSAYVGQLEGFWLGNSNDWMVMGHFKAAAAPMLGFYLPAKAAAFSGSQMWGIRIRVNLLCQLSVFSMNFSSLISWISGLQDLIQDPRSFSLHFV